MMGRPKNPWAHRFISPDTCSATFMKIGVAVDGELEVALIVERHRGQLAERVFAVEHPAVGTREERVRDVADAALDRALGLRGRPGALDPLALQVGRDVAANEAPLASILHLDVRARDQRLGSRNAMRCWPRARAVDARCAAISTRRSASSGARTSNASSAAGV